MTHSCLFSCNMYVQPIFILVNVSNKKITTSENTPPQRREVVVIVFELPLFSSTSLEDLVRKSKIMGWLVTYYTVIYIPKCSSTPFQPPAVSR